MVSDKTISIKRTLTPPSPALPTLPFDLIPEILSRLPVNSLLQFRCVCKLWKSLISDPKFAKMHLTLSTTPTLHCISRDSHNGHVLLKSYSPEFVLTNNSETRFPSSGNNVFFIGSCNGILCLVRDGVDLVQLQLWNPSIRKFKELPSISKPQKTVGVYGFGYDSISDNYKVLFVSSDLTSSKNELKVHTLGTDSWKSISEFPFDIFYARPLGQYVSGTINWLVFMGIEGFIASFDLGKECYQKLLLPDDSGKLVENKLHFSDLSVFRDCLYIMCYEDVWVMKEHGNKESWTKLFSIPSMQDPRASSYIRAMCVYEDEQVLLTYKDDKRRRHISYNYINNTSKFIIELENIPKVCVESLSSPYF